MIIIKGLRKSFKKQVILKDIHLSIKTKAIHGLVGKNGTGKSTLLNILGGILKADSGEITINQNEILAHNIHQRRQLGCVFDKPLYIDKLTGYEFLFFVAAMYNIPVEKAKERVLALMDLFMLTDDTDKFIERYSKGMRAKISLATAIIHNPNYLFLDEPFDGIDESSMPVIIKLLLDMRNNGTTILITSHQTNMLKDFCDVISIMDNGIII